MLPREPPHVGLAHIPAEDERFRRLPVREADTFSTLTREPQSLGAGRTRSWR